MKAIVAQRYGTADVLQFKEVEKPVPKDNEILVKVYATTVNRTDCAMLKAKPSIIRLFTGIFKPKKPIPGTDFAGKVESVGKDVTSFKFGDRIFGFDDMGLSSHAQYMTLSTKKALSKIPEDLIYEEAAACIEGAHYAYNMINKVKLELGDKVLVNGATGAIGSAAVQLLKYFGANVTAVCNTENLELIKSIGAAKVIDYLKDDFTKTKEKYKYIFDAVGKSSFTKCKPLLELGGVYISSELGKMAQNIFFALFTPLIQKFLFWKPTKKVVFPFPSNIPRSIQLIIKLVKEEKFRPVINKKYPLKDIIEAYRYVEKGQKTGNVVVTID